MTEGQNNEKYNFEEINKIKNELWELSKDVAGLKTSSILITNVKDDLANLRKAIEIVFWKDRRFWAGIIAIPVLIISGWLVKLLKEEVK